MRLRNLIFAGCVLLAVFVGFSIFWAPEMLAWKSWEGESRVEDVRPGSGFQGAVIEESPRGAIFVRLLPASPPRSGNEPVPAAP